MVTPTTTAPDDDEVAGDGVTETQSTPVESLTTDKLFGLAAVVLLFSLSFAAICIGVRAHRNRQPLATKAMSPLGGRVIPPSHPASRPRFVFDRRLSDECDYEDDLTPHLDDNFTTRLKMDHRIPSDSTSFIDVNKLMKKNPIFVEADMNSEDDYDYAGFQRPPIAGSHKEYNHGIPTPENKFVLAAKAKSEALSEASL